MKIEKHQLKDPGIIREIESQHINTDNPIENEIFKMENFISLNDAKDTLFTDKDAKITFGNNLAGKESCTITDGKEKVVFYTEKADEIKELKKL